MSFNTWLGFPRQEPAGMEFFAVPDTLDLYESLFMSSAVISIWSLQVDWRGQLGAQR